MELTLDSAPLADDQTFNDPVPEGGPRLCACGCGEPLRDGAKRAYIRGHKARMDAETVDADPDPADEPKRVTRKPSARITKSVQETIEAYLGILATGWAMRDPYCGSIALDHYENIAAKAAPLLAKNPIVVKYLTTGSNFKEAMDLALAMLPVIQAVYAHHMAHSVTIEQNEPKQNYNEYVA